MKEWDQSCGGASFQLAAATSFCTTVIRRLISSMWTGGLLWKVQRMTKTRRANAKARHARTQQVEDILKACAQEPQPDTASAPPAGTTDGPVGQPVPN